jgi:hypothetical protein
MDCAQTAEVARVQRLQEIERFSCSESSRDVEIHTCPFVNLPEAKSGRWGQGVTKAKMAECVWLKPDARRAV